MKVKPSSTQLILIRVLSLVFLSFHQILRGQEPVRPLRTEVPPIIDDKMDDDVWQQAPVVSDFKTLAPDYGREGSERTVAYMAYDRENLDFAFGYLDREPEKIKTAVTSRDNIRPDDWVCINLDTFNDHQSFFRPCSKGGIVLTNQ